MEITEVVKAEKVSPAKSLTQELTTDRHEIASPSRKTEQQARPDIVPKSETELESFDPTLMRVEMLLSTAFPFKQETATEKAFPAEQMIEKSEKPPSSTEVKQELGQILLTMQTLDETFDTSVKGIADEILPLVQQVDLSSAEDLARANGLLDTAISKIHSAKDAKEQNAELKVKYKKLQTDHERILLGEANAALGTHYDSFDQLSTARYENLSQVSILRNQRLWTGRFFNREGIRQLDKDRRIICSSLDQKDEVSSMKVSGPTPTYCISEETLTKTTIDVVKPIMEKLLKRYDELASNLQGRGTTTVETEIPASLKDSLDNDFINKYFLPYLDKCRTQLNPEIAANFSNPKHIQETVDIVKESLKLHHDKYFYPTRERNLLDEEIGKIKQLHDRVGKLPYEVQNEVTEFFGFDPFSWRPMEENYRALARLVQSTQGATGELVRVTSQKKFLKQIESLVSGDNLPRPIPIKDLLLTMSKRKDNISILQKKVDSLTDDFLESIDNRVWLTFLNNPQARQIFGAEKLDRTNLYLAKSMIEKIIAQDSSPDKTRNIGNRLLDIKSPATIPIIILNAYKDPNYFMDNAGTYPERTKFFKFISGFTEQELKQLGQENIPALLSIIDLIKSNPQSQRFDHLPRNEIAGLKRLDPASKAINRKLAEMSLQLLDKGDRRMEGFITSVFDNYDWDVVLEGFSQMQQEKGELPLNFSNAFMRRLRIPYPFLTKTPEKRNEIPEESYNRFHQSINYLLKEINDPKSNAYQNREYLINEHILRYIARQPERIEEALSLPSAANHLFSVLLKEGGPLHANANKIMENIFSNGNALKRAREIETIFSKKVPYWKQLYLFTDARIGEQLSAATSEYPITDVMGIPLKSLIEHHKVEKQKNPDAHTRLQRLIKNPEVVGKLESGELNYIPFTELNGVYKRLIFRDMLRRSVETSRNPEAKNRADSRNRILAKEGFNISKGTYIHGSAVDVIESVLLNGNLPKEALGEGAGIDSYPFHTDFSCLTHDSMSQQPNTEEVLNESISGRDGYGTQGTLRRDGQLFYIYRRTPDAYEGNKKYGPSDEHSLVLGGMPSTEISGIVLSNANATLEIVKKATLENGFYIPVYDLKGNLLVTPEDFDSLRREYNYTIPVEVWDYSLKTGEQLGSNPGGGFTVPTKQGPVKYYVKFAKPDGTDQVWNEQLADNIYRFLDIAIPNTKIVKVDTAYGHSSELLPHDKEQVIEDLKNGFIVDALLANWDIIANSGNVISSGGKVIRIDNGGSLFFRARGERKLNFNGIVTELDSMKGGYPGLTQEDIQNQLNSLRDKFTDNAINQLVDSVRLSTKDRDYLKTTLRQRRDYIFTYYSSEKSTAETEISEEGKTMDTLLRAETFDDVNIRKAIPEWERLMGEEGYQHNDILLGEHIKSAVSILKHSPEYSSLSEEEKSLALIATLFHDFGKPTGRKGGNIPRDFEHEIPSAQIAAEYMKNWGYANKQIKTIVQVIINDGIVSDIARKKIRDERKNLTPEQFKSTLNNDTSAIKILRALNRSDVIATVGTEGFNDISGAYNQYFKQVLS